MNNPSVARREAQVIDAVTDRGVLVFGPRDLRRFLGISDRNAYRILGNMAEKGIVTRLSRGRYVLTETYDERDSYEIASHLEPASYIGFWSALHVHGLTDQVPRTIFIAVTKQKRSLRIQGQSVEFVRISPEAFFGYDRYGEVVASDPEKTILDCLRLPRHAGGIEHVYRSIPGDLDVDRIVRYAERLESGAVAARLGYLLERKGMLGSDERLRNLVSSYSALEPGGDRVNPVAEWKLYANVTVDD